MSLLPKILDWLVIHPYYGGVVVGLGLGLPFIQPAVTPIALVAIVLIFWLLERVEKSALPLTLSLIFGCKALLALGWFWSVYPITWLFALSPSTQLLAIFFYWSTSALWLASAGVTLAICWRFVSGYRYRFYLLPFLWVASEYIGAVIFSILTIGPGGIVSGSFSFGHTGYLFSYLAPVASMGGVYAVGVTGLLGLVLGYQLVVQKRTREAVIGVVLVTIIATAATLSVQVIERSITITLLQTKFGADITMDQRAAMLEEMIISPAAASAEYLILPEDDRYIDTLYQGREVGMGSAIAAWRILHASTTAVIITSTTITNPETNASVLRAFVFNQASPIYTADKQYLVPQGEYMPSLYAFVLRMMGLRTVVDALRESRNYEPGTAMLSQTAPASVPNVLFCFESVSPLAAKRLVENRQADFIVHPMSHSWFHEPTVLWRQLETMLRFQAVYARTPIVSVGNEVRGQLYLPDGSIVQPTTITTFPLGTIDQVSF